MKKTLVSVLLGVLSTPSVFAAPVVIEDPCSDDPWLVTEQPAAAGKSVGTVTVAALDEAGMPYVGTDAGISSIKGTVHGNASIEVVSNTEMRAYGWCYAVNGVEPDRMPDQVLLQSEQDEVRWYFGYAHYKDGAWISYCTKTNETRPAYVCGER